MATKEAKMGGKAFDPAYLSLDLPPFFSTFYIENGHIWYW
jgi:hypothetical protein